jgi:hypothetical protein
MEVYRQLFQRNFHPLGTCAFVAHFRIGAKCRRRRQCVQLADEPVPSIKQVDTVVNTSVQGCAVVPP